MNMCLLWVMRSGCDITERSKKGEGQPHWIPAEMGRGLIKEEDELNSTHLREEHLHSKGNEAGVVIFLFPVVNSASKVVNCGFNILSIFI